MNWLGELIQKEILPTDTVLDLGCGIMQATTDSLTKTSRKRFARSDLLLNYFRDVKNLTTQSLVCKSLLGCELIDKYLEKAKNYFPVIKFDLTDNNQFDIFKDNSFDVVIALDVVEHIEHNQTLKIIGHMERIARKKIIIYTPAKFETNEKNVENAWGMGVNPFQEHKCYIPPTRFESWGYRVTFPEPDKNTLAIKVLK